MEMEEEREDTSSSVDIDEIIHRVAPNLSRCDFNLSQEERESKQTGSVPSYLKRRTSYSGIDRVTEVVSTPLLHQTVYLSVANLDSEEEEGEVEGESVTSIIEAHCFPSPF